MKIDSTLVDAVIERGLSEMDVIKEAWNEFQLKVAGLGVLQPELLGMPINLLTGTLERFDSMLSGDALQGKGDSKEVVLIQTRRAEIISKLMDRYSENMR